MMMAQIEASAAASWTDPEIEKVAGQVRRRHGLRSVPMDLAALARREGVAVQVARFGAGKLVGAIHRTGSEVAILIDPTGSPRWDRVVLAHLIGHHFLHLRSNGLLVEREANLFRRGEPPARLASGMEYEANHFAAALLLPRRAVARRWLRQPSVVALARAFQVPAGFAGDRIAGLGLD